MSKEKLIEQYKTTAHVFCKFVYNSDIATILKLTESKEYKDLMKVSQKLIDNGIEII